MALLRIVMESWVMERQFGNRWIVAIIAYGAFGDVASLAQQRETASAPPSGGTASHSESLREGRPADSKPGLSGSRNDGGGEAARLLEGPQMAVPQTRGPATSVSTRVPRERRREESPL